MANIQENSFIEEIFENSCEGVSSRVITDSDDSKHAECIEILANDIKIYTIYQYMFYS